MVGRPARPESLETARRGKAVGLALALAAVLTLGACSSVGSKPGDPAVPEAAATAEEAAGATAGGTPAVPLEAGGSAARSDPRPSRPVPDPVLEGSWSERDEFLERQAWYEELWQGRGSESFARYLTRMGAYEELVSEALEARELPATLRFLPIIESGYNPRAVSRAGAVGLWQLMASTAREAGLTVTPVVDERRDPWRSTEVALNFLAELHKRYQSWPLALSAYNSGPARVARLARRYAPDYEYGDSVYYLIRPHLPRETRDFIPKLMAAAAVASNAADYGFGDIVPETPLGFDLVTVPDATSVDVLADAAGVDQALVERLNPQLRRGFTPAGRETRVRVPAGTAPVFAENYARIPPDQRVTFLEHRIESGDTYWDIARAYGVDVNVLQAANPGTPPSRLRIGQWIVVPRVPSAGAAARSTTSASAPADGGVHVVRRGDTLWAIAQRYGVRVSDLRRWNDLGQGATIRPGDRLRVGQ